MISRYSREEMARIWGDEARFQIWLEIELLALKAFCEEGTAPPEAYKEVAARARFDVASVLEREVKLKHDVIAFLTEVNEHAGPLARHLHRGMTSSDVLDTAFAVQLKRAGELIVRGVQKLAEVILLRAEEHRYTPCIGRSHGIHAEPTTFGLKLLSWYAEMKRHEGRLKHAIEEIAVGKIAGAVGTYASVSPTVERAVLSGLGLRPETVPSQIVHRDRHGVFFTALAALGGSIERIAVEVRHLQRTEVREAQEQFTAGQKGSSAMPHKQNPVLSENITGLARLLRGYAVSAMENVALWHERDISHSSVERVIGPDACIVADFMVARCSSIVSGPVVHTDEMARNLDLTRGLVFSGSLLIALTDHGLTREEAYDVVQRHALAAWEGGATFPERVRADQSVVERLGAAGLDGVFAISRHFAAVDYIFDRAKSDGARDSLSPAAANV